MGSNDGASRLEVKAGQTVFIAKGERFKPEFPDGGTEYVPVCLPAFRPDRCAREDGPDSKVSRKLQELHGQRPVKKMKVVEDTPEILYHMLPVPAWEAAKKKGDAYFPPTFEQDAHITHATGVPSRLIDTANHYYKNESTTLTDESLMGSWVCPHIVGGIPISVVDAEFPIVRDGPTFVKI